MPRDSGLPCAQQQGVLIHLTGKGGAYTAVYTLYRRSTATLCIHYPKSVRHPGDQRIRSEHGAGHCPSRHGIGRRALLHGKGDGILRIGIVAGDGDRAGCRKGIEAHGYRIGSGAYTVGGAPCEPVITC